MTNEEDKLNPDDLLKAVQRQEKQQEGGKLKVFFGMSAGVGKTYSMLDEAHRKKKEGVQVVIGVINTHGRRETEALVEGLPRIKEKALTYKGVVFKEMDLEEILIQKPQLVLVDELAHTNVIGSKHLKRYQDVLELLSVGIDVYTTLNVQHIESRKDIVEGLTGIQIRETVPDLILERANSIELIDIPPQELLKRLKEGKVYLEDQVKIAETHFFQEESLTALREIALRFTAEKVDHDLHGVLQATGWKTRERLMVAISSSPSSEQLIRSTRRLAFELDAPWIVVYVDKGRTLNDQDQARLISYFNLSRELGAEVITTHDLDIAVALQRIAKRRDITRIIIGRPPKKKYSFLRFFQESFVDRLENENKEIDIVILRQEKKKSDSYQSKGNYQSFNNAEKLSSYYSSYLISFIFAIGVTLLGFLISPWIGYKSMGFIFLLGVLFLSLFLGRGPTLLAAFLSTICWDIFFLKPFYSPSLSDPEDIALVIIYFFVTAFMGTMNSKMREQDLFLHQREEQMEHLYEIEKEMVSATTPESLCVNVKSQLEKIFPGNFLILKQGKEKVLFLDEIPSLSEKEKAAIQWVFQKGKVAGWSTDTLPSSEGVYFPIKTLNKPVGVLAYYPKRPRPFSLEEMNFIQTITQQLGISLENLKGL